jgi:hypothetical protein
MSNDGWRWAKARSLIDREAEDLDPELRKAVTGE